jgi:hypothetical protein
MSSHRVYVALAEAYPTEADARAAITELSPAPAADIAYHGVRVHPTPERPLVHLFADMTDEQVVGQGWMAIVPREDAA